jgi:hypothetical protein
METSQVFEMLCSAEYRKMAEAKYLNNLHCSTLSYVLFRIHKNIIVSVDTAAFIFANEIKSSRI